MWPSHLQRLLQHLLSQPSAPSSLASLALSATSPRLSITLRMHPPADAGCGPKLLDWFSPVFFLTYQFYFFDLPMEAWSTCMTFFWHEPT